MKNLESYMVIETSSSVIALCDYSDGQWVGFSYNKTTHIDSTGGIELTEDDEYKIVATMSSIIEVTASYDDYIASL